MKRVILFCLVLSLALSVFAGCKVDKKNASVSGEYTATQEALLKENEEIEKLLKEKESDIDFITYRFRTVALDKVDNYYRFEKGEIKEFYTTFPYDGFIVKTKNGYFAWGDNSAKAFTTNEKDIIKSELRYDLLNTINLDITKGVVKYFVPEDVAQLKLSGWPSRPAGLTNDGRICLWGNSDDLVSTSKGVKYIEHKDKIVDFVRMQSTIYYVTSKGEMYTNEKAFGQNEHPTKEIYDEFFKISGSLNIDSICSGSHRQLAIKDKKGDYYIYDYFEDKEKWDFKKMEFPEKIVKAESAFEITFFLSESGNVYGYGKNGAQFYKGEETREINMEKLDLGFKVKDMNIDQASALFIDYDGILYGIAYGGGDGVLDSKEFTTDEWLFENHVNEYASEPVKIDIPDKVTKVKNNNVSGICETESGDIYVFGNNLDGTYLDGTRWSTYKPVKINK